MRGDLAALEIEHSPAPQIVVLQASGPGAPNAAEAIRELLESLNSRSASIKARIIIIGQSITANMHPLLVAALREIASVLSGGARIICDCPATEELSKDHVSRMAEWLKAEWGLAAAGPGAGEMSAQELTYFIVSGGQRALALRHILSTVSDQQPASILDIGAGIGFMSFLTALRGKAPMHHAGVVDVARKYKTPAERLWAVASEIEFEFELASAETYRPRRSFEPGLICQRIFRFSAGQHAEIFRHLMEALTPGGLLIINEIVRSDRGADGDWDALYPSCVPKSELLESLAPLGLAQLYLRDSGWKVAIDPASVSARQWASNSLLVLRRS